MRYMRLKIRRSVDLPQPDGPMKAVTLFAMIGIDTSWIAWKPPYQKLTLFTAIFTSSSSTSPGIAGGTIV